MEKVTNEMPTETMLMPEKIQVFLGPPESGKTRRAKELCEGKKYVIIDAMHERKYFNLRYRLGNVTEETEVIIFDDVLIKNLDYLIFEMFVFELEIEKQGRAPFKIKRPQIIITCNTLGSSVELGHSLQRRANFVYFPAQQTYLPEFKGMYFAGGTGKAGFVNWLADTYAKAIVLKDLGQDMQVIYLHESGEILHCDFNAKLYVGMFVNLEKLQPGDCIEMFDRGLGRFEKFLRLIVEEVTLNTKKGGQNV